MRNWLEMDSGRGVRGLPVSGGYFGDVGVVLGGRREWWDGLGIEVWVQRRCWRLSLPESQNSDS